MYKIYADETLIYDDTNQDSYLKVISPRLTMEDNAAGSLKMTIPPGNAGYDSIVRMVTNIRVDKDNKEIWSGRVLQESKDFLNQRQLTCEGELAYFNDTSQPPASYKYSGGYAINQYLRQLITNHNANVPASHQFTLGAVTVVGDISVTTNYEKTMECINKLVDTYGGHLVVRKQNGVRYLDYLKTEVRTNTQIIEFGKNLINFTKSFDSAEYATVLVPLGAKQDDQEIDGVDNYLTVKSVNGGSIYIQASQEVIDSYGWIEKVVHWDDVTDPSTLLDLGRSYLSDVQFDTMVLELSALDLHYLNPEIEDVRVGDRVCVNSAPHGMDHHFFPVVRLDIPLDQPQNTVFQFGDSMKTSLTSVNNKVNEELKEAINQNLDKDAILEAAKANAAAIMNLKTNGFITITTDDDETNEMYMSEIRPVKNPDGTFAAERFWRFNMNGLGYTDDGGQTWKAAMLMDGSILGDRIAAGSIHGSKITAGSLALTKTTGEEELTLGLESRGMAPDSFQIGDISSSTGANVTSNYYARSRQKIYLKAWTTVKMTNSSYRFEPYEYSNNTDAESGFVRSYGNPVDNKFTITSSNYYRFSVNKVGGGTVSSSELQTIADAFDLGGSSAVIRAEDLQIIGMVTLTDLKEEGSTVINGANISTGSITANKIDLYSGLTVYKKDRYGEQTSEKTFEIDDDGSVYVNGTVTLSENSVITFAQSTDMTLGDLAEEPVAKSIAGGTYAGDSTTFISNTEIRSPTLRGGDIIGARFAAVSSDDGQATSGGVLEFYDGRSTSGLGSRVGLLGFDFGGSGTPDQAKERLILQTGMNVALKFISQGNLSIEANGLVYINSLARLDNGFATARNYGYGTWADRPRNPLPGQIYFRTD